MYFDVSLLDEAGQSGGHGSAVDHSADNVAQCGRRESCGRLVLGRGGVLHNISAQVEAGGDVDRHQQQRAQKIKQAIALEESTVMDVALRPAHYQGQALVGVNIKNREVGAVGEFPRLNSRIGVAARVRDAAAVCVG